MNTHQQPYYSKWI